MSPRSSAANAALREQSQAKILTSAATLFAERGYEATSLAAITQHAGVSTGLANYYFTSKRDLLATLLGKALTQACTQVVATADLDPDVALAAIIDGVLAAAMADPRAHALNITVMVQPGVREVYAEVEATHADLLGEAEDRIRAIFESRGATDPALDEVLLRTVLEGATLKCCIYPEQYPVEAVRQRLHEMYDLPVGEALAANSWTKTSRLRAKG